VGIDKVRIWEKALAARPDVRKLKARLLANENPYGPSPAARLAMMENVQIGNRYGHSESADLISALAEMEGVPEDHILLGPGSSDLLEKTAIVMFQNGGNIVMADPSYMSLVKTAMYFDATMKAVPLTDTYAHDLPKMKSAIDADTKLVYICNPNNPTGSLTDADDLSAFCKSVSEQTPIFVDEAYLEFLEEGRKKSMVGLVAAGKDIIVSRTFSKIHGMAGLRVGYIVALPSTIEKITKLSRPNMGMNVASVKAALASLGDQQFQEMTRMKTKECREYIFQMLTEMGISYIPSYTSFIMFPLATDGEAYLKNMFDHGVGVRLFEIDGAPWSRVSMGTMEEMELFTKTLKTVLA
jgi:histidinol-phosphate aminotransferase